MVRVAQGLFGAPLMPLGQGILLATFPRHMHPLVLMTWGLGGVMGPVLGPVLGGLISEWLNWRWVFVFVAPVGLLSALLAYVALGDQERGTAGRLGALGFLALAVCMSSAQLLVDRGHRLDWIVIEAVLVVLALLVFIAHTTLSRNPFISPHLFRDWNFSLGIAVAFIMGTLSYTPIVLFPPLLQDLRAYPDSIIGYLMSARGVGNFVSFFIVVPLTRYNAKATLAVGLALQAYAGFEMAKLNINMSDVDIYWTNFVQGFGFGLAYTPMTALAFSTLAPRLMVEGSAIFNLMRNFGSSLFIALSILVLVRTTSENVAGLSEVISPVNELLRDPSVIGAWSLDDDAGLLSLRREIERQAAMGGYLNAFLLFAYAAAAAVPLVALFRTRREHRL